MKHVKTVTVGGNQFIIPEYLSDRQVLELGSMLLTLRPVQSVYSSDYNETFYWSAEEGSVKLGSFNVYDSRAEAELARDTYNAAVARKKAEADAQLS